MITVENIHKSFAGQEILRGVDLKIARGQSMVIIGGSGAGKSVLMKTMLGLEPPDQGRVLIEGAPLTPASRAGFLARIGKLFQGAALFDSLTVWENVAFRRMHGPGALPRRAARDLALERLARVGLAPSCADLYPAELSGGMAKRAGLARAIAADPEVIFFDEPTTGLDPIMAGVINDLIRGIVAEMGVTAVTITHDLSSLRAIADHVAMLHRGKIRWSGPVGQMDGADDPYLQQFIHGRAEGPIGVQGA